MAHLKPMLLGALFKEIGTPMVPVMTFSRSKTKLRQRFRALGEALECPISATDAFSDEHRQTAETHIGPYEGT